jgi:noranthrone synthase
MDLTKNIFVFGDQATHFVPDLELLLNTKGNVVLSSFLERVTYALRTEIGRVPGPQLEILPRFDTLLDLLAEAKTSELNPALELALLCITQLGCFIRYL